MARRLAGIASTALITAGLVLVVDVGVTLAWSEPVSTLRGWLAQRDAAEELEDLEREFRPRPDGHSSGREVRRLADRLAAETKSGGAIGRIQIDSIDLNIVLIHGTDTGSLKKGPGHYPETVFPGQAGTVGIAGHRTTYLAPFRRIDEIEDGDEIVLEMPYATFTYRFETQRIVEPSRVGVVRDVAHDRVVLTACHPLYSAAQRIVVFAELEEVSAPDGTDEPRAQAANLTSAPDPPGLGPTWAGVGGLGLVAAVVWATGSWRDSRRARGHDQAQEAG
jgi:sortase A